MPCLRMYIGAGKRVPYERVEVALSKAWLSSRAQGAIKGRQNRES